MEKARNFVQENGRIEVKRERRMKNNREKKREKRKVIQQVTNSIFLQNEVTN